MRRLIARRAGMLVAALLVSSVAVFAALDLAPGDPLSALSGGRELSPAAKESLRIQYHLSDGFAERYWHWLTGALQGDLGTSISLRVPVSSVIADRAAVTFELVLFAALLIVVVGIGLGLLSGLRRGAVDTAILAVSSALAAIPSFVAAIVLITIFAVGLGWLPALGAGSGLGGRVQHLTLPAVALALSAMAVVVRVTRVSVRAELEREHVQTAISRGLPYRSVIRRHVLRNAAIPVTTVTGITITSLIAVSAVVEQAFNLNGLGSTLVQAAQSKDYPLVQGIALIFVAAFVIANTAVDALYAALDPTLAARSQTA